MSRSDLQTGSLHWSDTGETDRRALLLLHALGTDLRMWRAQLDHFRSARRVVAVELPGHGLSTARAGEYSHEELGGDVLAIADRAALEEFDICGISMGGFLGLWLAATFPDRVRSLIASNTAARIGSRELWVERMKAVSRHGMEGIRGQVIGRFVSGDFSERDPKAYALLEEMLLAVDPVGYIGCCAALRDADLREVVATVSCPTLLIAGAADIATPPAEAEWLQSLIGGSRLEVIPGAAHLANIDQPEIFTRLVLAALEQPTERPA